MSPSDNGYTGSSSRPEKTDNKQDVKDRRRVTSLSRKKKHNEIRCLFVMGLRDAGRLLCIWSLTQHHPAACDQPLLSSFVRTSCSSLCVFLFFLLHICLSTSGISYASINLTRERKWLNVLLGWYLCWNEAVLFLLVDRSTHRESERSYPDQVPTHTSSLSCNKSSESTKRATKATRIGNPSFECELNWLQRGYFSQSEVPLLSPQPLLCIKERSCIVCHFPHPHGYLCTSLDRIVRMTLYLHERKAKRV